MSRSVIGGVVGGILFIVISALAILIACVCFCRGNSSNRYRRVANTHTHQPPSVATYYTSPQPPMDEYASDPCSTETPQAGFSLQQAPPPPYDAALKHPVVQQQQQQPYYPQEQAYPPDQQQYPPPPNQAPYTTDQGHPPTELTAIAL